MVEVCAISFPEFKWLKNVVAFTKASFHDESYFEIYKNLKDEEVEPFLTKIIEMGHESVLEHITFTFLIFDISRWATHQLVRHRIASYTQKSLRKERPIEPDMFVIDDEFPEKLLPAVNKYYDTVTKFYKNLIERGVPAEVARGTLPGSIKSEIAWTVNLRSLRNFLQQRLSKHAQAEIRELAEMIVSIFVDLECEYLLKGIVEFKG